jgi:hypothetical protein
MPKTDSFTNTAPFDATDGSIQRTSSWSFNDFNSLSVPGDAAIEGILIHAMVGTNGGTNPANGSFTIGSSSKGINEAAWTLYPGIAAVTAGAIDYLWEQSWTPALANNITISFSGTYTYYWDSVAVEIHYNQNSDIYTTLSSGLIKLTSGKVSL